MQSIDICFYLLDIKNEFHCQIEFHIEREKKTIIILLFWVNQKFKIIIFIIFYFGLGPKKRI